MMPRDHPCAGDADQAVLFEQVDMVVELLDRHVDRFGELLDGLWLPAQQLQDLEPQRVGHDFERLQVVDDQDVVWLDCPECQILFAHSTYLSHLKIFRHIIPCGDAKVNHQNRGW